MQIVSKHNGAILNVDIDEVREGKRNDKTKNLEEDGGCWFVSKGRRFFMTFGEFSFFIPATKVA